METIQGWTGLGATWSSTGCPSQWNKMSFKVRSQPNHSIIPCPPLDEQQVVGVAQLLPHPFGACYTHRTWGQGWNLCQGWGTSTKGRLVSPLLSIHLMQEVTTGCLTQNSCCGRGSPTWGPH